jgi:hypothetical protein
MDKNIIKIAKGLEIAEYCREQGIELSIPIFIKGVATYTIDFKNITEEQYKQIIKISGK